MEYLTLNQDCNIIEASLAAKRFADCPSEIAQGKKVYEGFPELIGLEDTLAAIFQGRQENFQLKGIGRVSKQGLPLYINLYVLKSQDEENLESHLVILLEDVTEKMVLEQKLVQLTNEISLLLEDWSYFSNYLDRITKFMADA